VRSKPVECIVCCRAEAVRGSKVCLDCYRKRENLLDAVRKMTVPQFDWDGAPAADERVVKNVLSKSTAFLDAYNRTTKKAP